jgi:proteasome lid subunit RPN8/RPN11
MKIEVHRGYEFEIAEETEPRCGPHPPSQNSRDACVFLSAEAVRKAVEWSRASFSQGREAIGYLLGRPFLSGGKLKIRVSDTAELPAVATAHHVEIDRNAACCFEISRNELIVGWYHSHTGQGCFMSATDIRTHERWFRQAYSVALVIEGSDGTFEIFAAERDRFYTPAFCIFDEEQR